MKPYFTSLFVFLSLFLNSSIAQDFDKIYDETFFDRIEIQSDGYLLHFERPSSRTEANSVKQLKTDLEGNLIYVENDTFLLSSESDFYFLTEPIWIDPSVPYQYREYEQYAVKKIEVRTNQVVWEAPIDLGFRYRIMEVQLNGGGPTVSVYEGLENTFVTTHTSPARNCCPNNFKFTKLDVEGNVVFYKSFPENYCQICTLVFLHLTILYFRVRLQIIASLSIMVVSLPLWEILRSVFIFRTTPNFPMMTCG